MSAIRLIDRVLVGVSPEWDGKTNIPVALNGVISVKSGDARGEHELKVVLHTPKNEAHEVMKASFQLEGDEQGANIRIRAVMMVRSEGLYWFDIVVAGKQLTRIPLRIQIQRVPADGFAGSDPREGKPGRT